MEKFASADLTAGQLNAIVKKLGGKDGALRFLRGETSISEPKKSRYEHEGVIYFSVTSDGTTGAEWIIRLEKKGFRVSDYSKRILLSKDFKPTTGITTEVAVLNGILFEENQRVIKNIREVAVDRKLETPNVEISCLIREKFTDEDIEAMGLIWIVIMHEPINDSDSDSQFLIIVDRNDNGRWLDVSCDELDDIWNIENGFAFAISQVNTW